MRVIGDLRLLDDDAGRKILTIKGQERIFIFFFGSEGCMCIVEQSQT